MDITRIVTLIVELICTLCTVIVIPYLKMLIETKIGNEKAKSLMIIVKTFVSAAEQIYDIDQGAEKKNYVLKKLHDHGFDIDDDLIENTIEAAVLELHNSLA